MFVEAGDVLRPGALRLLVDSLERSGSDFAMGGGASEHGRRRPEQRLDGRRSAGERMTPVNLPEAMEYGMPSGVLYRREFWVRAGLSIGDGGSDDLSLGARAFARARSFDLLRRDTVAPAAQRDPHGLAVSATATADRFRELFEALDILRREAGEEVARHRLVQFLGNEVARMASRLPDMDETAYDVFASGLARLAPPEGRREVWDDVSAAPKVLYALVLADDEARARAFVDRSGLEVLRHRMVGLAGAAYVCLPYWGDAAASVDVGWFRASPRDLRAFERHGVPPVTARREPHQVALRTGMAAPDGEGSGGAGDRELIRPRAGAHAEEPAVRGRSRLQDLDEMVPHHGRGAEPRLAGDLLE